MVVAATGQPSVAPTGLEIATVNDSMPSVSPSLATLIVMFLFAESPVDHGEVKPLETIAAITELRRLLECR